MGVVELADTYDLGAVTSVKFFLHAADSDKSRFFLFLKIVDQAKCSTSAASPCKNSRHNRISGCGGIGRLGGFRCCHLSEGFSSMLQIVKKQVHLFL